MPSNSGSIGLWRDGAWAAVGDGLGGLDVLLRDGLLIAVGLFRLTDREDRLVGFAVWDGATWSSWGSEFTGIDSSVRCVGEFRGDLIVAGEFERIGSATYSQIARWDSNLAASVERLPRDEACTTSSSTGPPSWREVRSRTREAQLLGAGEVGGSAWNPFGSARINGTVYALSNDRRVSSRAVTSLARAGCSATAPPLDRHWLDEPRFGLQPRGSGVRLVSDAGEYFCARAFTDYNGASRSHGTSPTSRMASGSHPGAARVRRVGR
ncbi:MAG: hypothetical protein R3E97_21965 [Candidatus Eisenbacteria bacterium]